MGWLQRLLEGVDNVSEKVGKALDDSDKREQRAREDGSDCFISKKRKAEARKEFLRRGGKYSE